MKSIGTRIKAERKKRKLTQRDLAAMLGVSYQTVAYWENCSRRPHRRHWSVLSEVLGIPLSSFPLKEAEQNSTADPFGYFAVHKIKTYESANSERLVTEEDATKIAAALGISVEELMGGAPTAEQYEEQSSERIISRAVEVLRAMSLYGKNEALNRLEEMASLSKYQV